MENLENINLSELTITEQAEITGGCAALIIAIAVGFIGGFIFGYTHTEVE